MAREEIFRNRKKYCEGDWVPRSVHKNSKIISETIRKVENQIGKDPKDRDIAEALNISLGAYHQLLQDSLGAKIFGFDDIAMGIDSVVDGGRDPLPGPLEKIQSNDFKKQLGQFISVLHQELLVILIMLAVLPLAFLDVIIIV